MRQRVLAANDSYQELDNYLNEKGIKRILLVCGKSATESKIGRYFDELVKKNDIQIVRFSDFQPNPQYESVQKGVKAFGENNCDAIVAVGGGSAMDVAKCIKLYANGKDDGQLFFKQQIIPNQILLIAVPTTAGTGSEATKYAVIYYAGEKQSIADDSCIPDVVLLDAELLNSLPLYQRKVTMLDALCHAIESFWSVNSTEESREYSKRAISDIMKNYRGYLQNTKEANCNMLYAANVAGKAINITQTTAGHAMSYKLTSLYGIAHGHAVALCIAALWPFMVAHPQQCVDVRGEGFLAEVYQGIAEAMGCRNVTEAIAVYQDMLRELELEIPKIREKADFDILKVSVNPVRLKNHPIYLDEQDVDKIYHEVLCS